MALRWKLLITNLSVAMLVIILLGGYVESALHDYYRQELTESLQKSALLVRELVGPTIISGDNRALDKLAKRLYRETRFRFTFLDMDGKVLGDGIKDPAMMENHANRPEVHEALRKGLGVRSRHSDSLGFDMLYTAVPVREHGRNIGVIRGAIPMAKVDEALERTRAAFAAVMLVAVLLAVLASAKLANHIAGPVQELREKAIRITRGDLDQKVENSSTDEIGDLARAFSQMASQIKSMVTAATEEGNKIRAIFSGMSDGVLVVDPAGRVTLINEAAQASLGLDSSSALSGSVISVTRNHEIDSAVTQAKNTLETRQIEVRLPLPEERTLSLMATPVLDNSNELLAVVVILHDITDIRKLERVRRDFVASASHELRTPIASIRVMVESLMAGGEDDPALREQFLQAIQDSSNRLAALVDDLLTLSTLEHPAKVLSKQPVLVQELVDRVLPLFTNRAKRKGLILQARIPDGLTIHGDFDLLDHALVNLLDNAIKYTVEGSVKVGAESKGNSVLVYVTDSGPGIPSQHLPRIFERFYRVDKARSRELGGTGLGLSIVKHVAEEHGGTVEVQSELGKGSTFILKIPNS